MASSSEEQTVPATVKEQPGWYRVDRASDVSWAALDKADVARMCQHLVYYTPGGYGASQIAGGYYCEVNSDDYVHFHVLDVSPDFRKAGVAGWIVDNVTRAIVERAELQVPGFFSKDSRSHHAMRIVATASIDDRHPSHLSIAFREHDTEIDAKYVETCDVSRYEQRKIPTEDEKDRRGHVIPWSQDAPALHQLRDKVLGQIKEAQRTQVFADIHYRAPLDWELYLPHTSFSLTTSVEQLKLLHWPESQPLLDAGFELTAGCGFILTKTVRVPLKDRDEVFHLKDLARIRGPSRDAFSTWCCINPYKEMQQGNDNFKVSTSDGPASGAASISNTEAEEMEDVLAAARVAGRARVRRDRVETRASKREAGRAAAAPY